MQSLPILFILNLQFPILLQLQLHLIHSDGIGQHMEAAMKWGDIQSFIELLGTFGEVLLTNGEVIETL
jgi:hypothetical protein